MNPVIELPIALRNSEGEETVSVGRFKPGQLAYWYRGFYNGTVLVMNSGQSFFTPVSYEAINSALDAYDSNMSKKMPAACLQITLEPKEKPAMSIVE